jgi:hypothetical protein
MGAFLRRYTFLSQIFDYGNTALEKRSIFYKQVLRLLVFGREREGIDLSKVRLVTRVLVGSRVIGVLRFSEPQPDRPGVFIYSLSSFAIVANNSIAACKSAAIS